MIKHQREIHPIPKIKVFTLTHMLYSPFSTIDRDPEDSASHAGGMCLQDWGRGLFIPTDDRREADGLVGCRHEEPNPKTIAVIWRHELSLSHNTQPIIYQDNVSIYNFNFYCMNIYHNKLVLFHPKPISTHCSH